MDKLNFILPEVFISLSIMLLLLLGVYKKNSSNIVHNLAVGSLLVTGILIFNNPLDQNFSLFNDSYIVDNLSSAKTVNVKSGSLFHLCSTISGSLKSFDDYNSVIKLIHPTPAVCGIPLNVSKEFISLNESYDRSYYTGYLGIISPKKKSVKLYVNLRCAEVFDSFIKIYVGGGITNKSNPIDEYEETLAKSYIMKNVFY